MKHRVKARQGFLSNTACFAYLHKSILDFITSDDKVKRLSNIGVNALKA